MESPCLPCSLHTTELAPTLALLKSVKTNLPLLPAHADVRQQFMGVLVLRCQQLTAVQLEVRFNELVRVAFLSSAFVVKAGLATTALLEGVVANLSVPTALADVRHHCASVDILGSKQFAPVQLEILLDILQSIGFGFAHLGTPAFLAPPATLELLQGDQGLLTTVADVWHREMRILILGSEQFTAALLEDFSCFIEGVHLGPSHRPQHFVSTLPTSPTKSIKGRFCTSLAFANVRHLRLRVDVLGSQ